MNYKIKVTALTFAAMFAGGFGVAACADAVDEATQPSKQPAEQEAPAKPGPQQEAPATQSDVKLNAQHVEFERSILAESGQDYTAVEVTVTNNKDEALEVDTMHFAVVDATGGKYYSTAAYGSAENEIGFSTLYPGEHVTGVVSFEGDFTPETLEFNSPLMMDPIARAEVAPK